MAAYIDISDSQMKRLIKEHVSSFSSVDMLTDLIMSLLGESEKWEDVNYLKIQKKIAVLIKKTQYDCSDF